jgi:heavy metal sensor kinase
MRRQLSLRSRLTVWYTLVLLVVLSLFGADVLWQQGRIGVRRVDRELEGIAGTLANVLGDELTETSDVSAAADEARTTVATPGHAVVVLNDRGTLLAAHWEGLRLPDRLPPVDEGPVTWTTDAAMPWRVRAQPFAAEGLRFVLIVATPFADVLRERREAQEAMLVGIPIVLLLAAAGGSWLASIGLRPITEMAERASRIPLTGGEDLGESDRADELGTLARAFNQLVARLRAALQTQRQFMADASHELRTPVSVIRSAADVTLARDGRSEAEYRESLSIVRGEARRLGTLVEDMLVLARADAGGYPLRPVSLYLDDLVEECRRAVDVLATERGVVVRSHSTGEVPLRGDEDLLRRMLLNLLQNAVQHTPPGGVVTVSAACHGSAVAIRVRDEGAGVADADRERIFDRFVQLEAARSGHGAGLGLPIARWIAEAHGGSLALESTGPGGSTFLVTFEEQATRTAAP